jgi:A/G-specific adenine glycosylase
VGSRAALATWFEPRRSLYPWRGERDPYRVLVSEVMLQQTQAARVIPAYYAFLERFPDVATLAASTRADVLRAWAGLGHNRRAVALWDAARAVNRDHDGLLPREREALERLPGVGAYTAAAVASIAFGHAVPAIDTNARRVVARARLGSEPEHLSAAQISQAAATWLDRTDPGAWNQAVMDLGRELCRPAPRCEACPLARWCRFRRVAATRKPSSPRRRKRSAPFEGSTRQARGRVVAHLRTRRSATLESLAATMGLPLEGAAKVMNGLVADGLVAGGPVARAGRARGRVRLP